MAKLHYRQTHISHCKCKAPLFSPEQPGSLFNVTFILKAFHFKDFRGMTGASGPDALCILPNWHLFHLSFLGNALRRFVVKAD